MKKHDEGYVLAYVTVVLLVFCLVATVILTGAMQNLRAQQNSIAQMEDKYAAQGMIEKAVAQLNADKSIGTIDGLTVSEDTTTGEITLTAQSGTVKITCTLTKSGNTYAYTSYTTETGGGGE